MANLSSVDLNLFVVLRAVLQERSATRAAARLHVTQSAVSNALARLRVLLDDPLVVRTGRGFTPTPRALAIQAQLDAALNTLESLTEDMSTFDLATTSHEWVIACAELYGPILLPALVDRLQREAPNASLRMITPDRMDAAALERGEPDLYLGIPTNLPAGWRSEPGFADDTVGVMRAEHPEAAEPMTLDRFVGLTHAHVRVTPDRGREVDDALARVGRTRRLAVVVPYFSAAFAVVESSDCVAAVPRRLADSYRRHLALRIFDIPLALPRHDVHLHWHARADTDPGITALRTMIHDALGATR